MTLARAAGEIDTAQLLLERACVLADDPDTLTALTITRNLRDSALAVETMVTAVDRLFRMAGTSGQTTSSPVQRFWRDVNTAASHVALQFEPAAGAYAKALFEDERALANGGVHSQESGLAQDSGDAHESRGGRA
jgi:two-component flavin-dependent monooxygenase/oxygenase LndZ5